MKEYLIDILNEFKTGKIDIKELISILHDNDHCEKSLLNAHIVLDNTREKRCGFPEFIFGENKSPEQLIEITNNLYEKRNNILVTRLNKERYAEIRNSIPKELKYDEIGRVLYYVNRDQKTEKKGIVSIVTAGTSDIPVALEAKYTIEVCGYEVRTHFDTGVAGIHRIFNRITEIRKSDVIIVVAGMEGALPSVIGGLVSVPVIAVPVSVGYGAALGGLTALFSMLNSCANGITVVNIDSGFGAACAAVRILNKLECRI